MSPTEYTGGAIEKRFDGASKSIQQTFEKQKENQNHEPVVPGRRARSGCKQPNYDRVKDILCRFALAIQEEEEKEYVIEVPLQESGGIAGGGADNLGTEIAADQ